MNKGTRQQRDPLMHLASPQCLLSFGNCCEPRLKLVSLNHILCMYGHRGRICGSNLDDGISMYALHMGILALFIGMSVES